MSFDSALPADPTAPVHPARCSGSWAVNPVLEPVSHILWVSAPDGATVYVNRFCAEYTGRPRAANYRWGWPELVHPRDAKRAETQWRAAVGGGTEFRTEYRIQRHDGTFRWHSLRATPLRDPGGTVNMWVGSATDVHDERRRRGSMARIDRIREAIDDQRLVLFAQPIQPLRGGRPSEELLLRMVDRDGTLVPPDTFVPVAEEHGLMGEIDRWVIARAMRRAVRGDRVVAVNVSAASMGTGDLLSSIRSGLVETGVDPADLIFEITETALMKDLALGETFARTVAGLGCGLALDDFGTGFGSLTYLKRFPVTHLKIDRDFVRGLTGGAADRRVVEGIVALAAVFGLATVAEGVEDEWTLDRLRRAGVDFAQGFHLGRPVPID